MTTLLRTALHLPMNKSKVLPLAFISPFLNEGHTKKSLQPPCLGQQQWGRTRKSPRGKHHCTVTKEDLSTRRFELKAWDAVIWASPIRCTQQALLTKDCKCLSTVEGFYGYLDRCVCKTSLFTACLFGFKILKEFLQLICFAWLSQILLQQAGQRRKRKKVGIQ